MAFCEFYCYVILALFKNIAFWSVVNFQKRKICFYQILDLLTLYL